MTERKSILVISLEIKKLLENKREMSIRQISNELKIQWRTTEKSLEFLKELKIVTEHQGTENKVKTRIFRLKEIFNKNSP